jgi:large subunit ribosomal protein L10
VLRNEKERIVAELVERLRASDTLIVADYRGLSMTEMDEVRTKLLEHGAGFSVVKNTLTKRAAEEAGVPALVELLDGPSAIAFVGDGDMVAVAKALSETARRTRILEIRGALLQGAPVDGERVRELATLPPVETLRGQVLGAIIGPLNAIAGLVNAPLQDLVGLVDARIEQVNEEGTTPGEDTTAETAVKED